MRAATGADINRSSARMSKLLLLCCKPDASALPSKLWACPVRWLPVVHRYFEMLSVTLELCLKGASSSWIQGWAHAASCTDTSWTFALCICRMHKPKCYTCLALQQFKSPDASGVSTGALVCVCSCWYKPRASPLHSALLSQYSYAIYKVEATSHDS